MCGKLGNDEIETVENMMSMAVCFVIADTFDLDVDDLEAETHLIDDLGMNTRMQKKLDLAIKDMFDEFKVDFSRVTTVGDLVQQVARVTVH